MPWERRTRRLLAQGVAWLALVSLGSWFAGCSGPSVGDVVTLPSQAALYTDEALFKSAVELERAKSQPSRLLSQSEAWHLLGRGSTVRILATAPGGYKIVVETAKDTLYGEPSMPGGVRTIGDLPKLHDKIGWILANDLTPP